MIVLIPSFRRPGGVTTPGVLWPMPYRIAVHTERDRDLLLTAQPDLRPEWIRVSNVPVGPIGANAQRAWLAREYGVKDQWHVFADDNVLALHGVPEAHYEESVLPFDAPKAIVRSYGGETWYQVFRQSIDADTFGRTIRRDIALAEALGFRLIGFPTQEAYLYRAKHFRLHGFVSGKLMIWKHDPNYPWEQMCHYDDVQYSAEAHLRDGGVLIDNWIYPDRKHFQPGGLGTYDERVPTLLRDVRFLLERYPGLMGVMNRKGWVPGTCVEFLLKTPEAIAQWRRGMQQLIR